MRKYTLALLLLSAFTFAVQAQCDKQIKMKCDRTIMVNQDGSMGEVQDMPVDILITKDSIRINASPPQGDIEIKGPLSDKNCKINSSYTDGIYTFRSNAIMSKQDGDKEMKLIFTLEVKDGKFKLYGEKDVPKGESPEKMYFEVKEQKVF